MSSLIGKKAHTVEILRQCSTGILDEVENRELSPIRNSFYTTLHRLHQPTAYLGYELLDEVGSSLGNPETRSHDSGLRQRQVP
jgi:hypothetical protein